MIIDINRYNDAVEQMEVLGEVGKVIQVTGFLIKAIVPGVRVGSLCEIQSGPQNHFMAEVVGFDGQTALLMPLEALKPIGHGSRVVLKKAQSLVNVGEALLGRVIDGLGRPLDGLGEIETSAALPLYADTQNPLERQPIREPMSLGVRAIDAMLTVGKGQRVGIMAGSGVGKSVLMGMMARASSSDVNVIALVGERGREVKEFIEDVLGEEGMKRSIVIVATSDQSPLVRMRAAFVATTIAEYFCRQNNDVLMMMDSVTRFAMAQREIGLSIGEPPATKGYTPSVFGLLPKLLERAGNFEGNGSITGLYTVLVEGDDMDDPIGDAVRSIVDGHIVLSRKLTHKGHFPAIDVMQSTSRVMPNIVSREHRDWAMSVRQIMAQYSDAEDLINIGAYKQGSNPKIDQAIHYIDPIIDFLRQDLTENSDWPATVKKMQGVFGGGEA